MNSSPTCSLCPPKFKRVAPTSERINSFHLWISSQLEIFLSYVFRASTSATHLLFFLRASSGTSTGGSFIKLSHPSIWLSSGTIQPSFEGSASLGLKLIQESRRAGSLKISMSVSPSCVRYIAASLAASGASFEAESSHHISKSAKTFFCLGASIIIATSGGRSGKNPRLTRR